MPLPREHAQVLDKSRFVLTRDLEMQYGFYSVMRAEGLINALQEEGLKGNPDGARQREAVLGILDKGNAQTLGKFLNCLEQTNQQALADFIKKEAGKLGVHLSASQVASGVPVSSVPAAIPGPKDGLWHKPILLQNDDKIKEVLEVSDALLKKMAGYGVLNNDKYEEIKETDSNRKKKEKLLEYLQRRPVANYLTFRKCLVEVDQEHVLDYLPEAPVM